jgi:hypothetical protein
MGFRRHFGFCDHFVELHHLWLIFLGARLDYQQIFVKKMFLLSLLGDIFVEILDFGQHISFISWLTIFPIKNEYFLTQTGNFLKIKS